MLFRSTRPRGMGARDQNGALENSQAGGAIEHEADFGHRALLRGGCKKVSLHGIGNCFGEKSGGNEDFHARADRANRLSEKIRDK